MAQPYPIIGAEGSGVQTRLELHDLQKNPVQFSLFIRALERLHNMTNTEDVQSPHYINKPNSWWQIGGIHGLPYTPWSGDPNGPQKPDPNSAWEGYCYHASALFPTWHRVLLMLVEQAVVREAIDIALDLEKKDSAARDEKWIQAATHLRFPFWDWTRSASAKEGIPQIFQDPVIQIVHPGGSYGRVKNPLNHYHFTLKPGSAHGVEYMGTWDRTYRWANDDLHPTEEMYDQSLKGFSEGVTINFQGKEHNLNPIQWLKGKVAGLFTYDLTLEDPSYGPNMWGYFSNVGASSAKIYCPVNPMPPSIEEPHNMVHIDTGGNGSMSVNEYAGFDPIFYLHHCNVDRIYAFWEYLYPKYWIENGWKNEKGETVPFTTNVGTFTQDSNTTVDHTSPLMPFRNKALDYWTSEEIRSLLPTNPINKYYTYPAIKDLSKGTEVKVDVPYDVDDISIRETYQAILYNTFNPDLPDILHAYRNVTAKLPQHVDLLLKEENEIAHLRHFFIVGELPEFAFSGSYRLELYLLPKDHRQTAVQVVNNISVLGRANPNKCPGCRDRRAAGYQIRGFMHLDPRLLLHLLEQVHHSRLPSITDLDAMSVLIQESFGLRLVKPDGTKIAAADPYTGTHNGPLDKAKMPQLMLHSHVISFNHKDATASVKFRHPMTHGKFGDHSGWKAF